MTTSALINTVRALRNRAERLKSGRFYAEGNRVVAQAIAAGYDIDYAVVAPDIVSSDLAWASLAQLAEQGVPLHEMGVKAFNRLSFKRNPSGIGAVVRARTETLDAIDTLDGLGWVALDSVGNAGNLGAILRTTDAVGCAGVIMLGHTTDVYHPDTVRASMGAIFQQRLVSASFEAFATWVARHGHPVVGTSGDVPTSYREVRYPLPLIVLMGSERLGLSAEQQAICTHVVHIPMVGTVDSLNLSVATGVILYELLAQSSA
jgi:TrmH family RNA methyltransferase